MKYLLIAAALAVGASTVHAHGTLDSYMKNDVLKECPSTVESIKTSTPLFKDGKVAYQDRFTYSCNGHYIFKHTWKHSTKNYKVFFWNGPTADPIIVKTTSNSVIKILPPGNWTIQVEAVDSKGNGLFSTPVYLDFKI